MTWRVVSVVSEGAGKGEGGEPRRKEEKEKKEIEEKRREEKRREEKDAGKNGSREMKRKEQDATGHVASGINYVFLNA